MHERASSTTTRRFLRLLLLSARRRFLRFRSFARIRGRMSSDSCNFIFPSNLTIRATPPTVGRRSPLATLPRFLPFPSGIRKWGKQRLFLFGNDILSILTVIVRCSRWVGPQTHYDCQFGNRWRTGFAQSLPYLGPETILVLIAIMITVLSSIPPLLPLLHAYSILTELFILPQRGHGPLHTRIGYWSTGCCSRLGRCLPLPRLLAVLFPLLPLRFEVQFLNGWAQ